MMEEIKDKRLEDTELEKVTGGDTEQTWWFQSRGICCFHCRTHPKLVRKCDYPSYILYRCPECHTDYKCYKDTDKWFEIVNDWHKDVIK